MSRCSGGVVLVLIAAACHTPPPRTWLRFQPAGQSEWRSEAGHLVGRLQGADVAIDLNRVETKVLVTVENRTGGALEFRVGPDDALPTGAIGQVLLRPVDDAAAGGPDYLPYNSKQAQAVAAGQRATFYIDKPLGRDVAMDQFFVLGIEARNAAGVAQRRTLPLRAVNGGVIPADGR